MSLGVSAEYPRQLERRLEVAVSRGKALFPGHGDTELWGLEWIGALCGPTDRPLYALNCYALSHRVNGLCFCRSSILFFRRNAVLGQFSHEADSVAGTGKHIDSW